MDLWLVSAADPDLELRGEGIVLIAPPVFRPSVISYIFTQNKGGRGRTGFPGPSLRTSTVYGNRICSPYRENQSSLNLAIPKTSLKPYLCIGVKGLCL